MERSAQAQWCIPGWGRATYIYIYIHICLYFDIYIYLYLYSASFYQKYIYIYIYIIAYLDLTVLENLYLFKPAILRSSKYGFKEITRGLLSGFVFEL